MLLKAREKQRLLSNLCNSHPESLTFALVQVGDMSGQQFHSQSGSNRGTPTDNRNTHTNACTRPLSPVKRDARTIQPTQFPSLGQSDTFPREGSRELSCTLIRLRDRGKQKYINATTLSLVPSAYYCHCLVTLRRFISTSARKYQPGDPRTVDSVLPWRTSLCADLELELA